MIFPAVSSLPSHTLSCSGRLSFSWTGDNANADTDYVVLQRTASGARAASSLEGGKRNSANSTSAVAAAWQRDEAVTQCQACDEPFGIFKRKHHW